MITFMPQLAAVLTTLALSLHLIHTSVFHQEKGAVLVQSPPLCEDTDRSNRTAIIMRTNHSQSGPRKDANTNRF